MKNILSILIVTKHSALLSQKNLKTFKTIDSFKIRVEIVYVYLLHCGTVQAREGSGFRLGRCLSLFRVVKSSLKDITTVYLAFYLAAKGSTTYHVAFAKSLITGAGIGLYSFKRRKKS